MGDFVNMIRKKMGLEPVRDVTMTGKIPNDVIINTNVKTEEVDMDDSAAYTSNSPTAYADVTNPIAGQNATKTRELPDDGGHRRGSRVKIHKKGYEGEGNVDFYDRNTGKYVVSGIHGTNLLVHKDEISPMKQVKLRNNSDHHKL